MELTCTWRVRSVRGVRSAAKIYRNYKKFSRAALKQIAHIIQNRMQNAMPAKHTIHIENRKRMPFQKGSMLQRHTLYRSGQSGKYAKGIVLSRTAKEPSTARCVCVLSQVLTSLRDIPLVLASVANGVYNNKRHAMMQNDMHLAGHMYCVCACQTDFEAHDRIWFDVFCETLSVTRNASLL